MDVVKALIIGPEGTPYQNGVFAFDILLPTVSRQPASRPCLLAAVAVPLLILFMPPALNRRIRTLLRSSTARPRARGGSASTRTSSERVSANRLLALLILVCHPPVRSANGKVCLSLLGTWAGPGWDPVHSTLLQVLISIQVVPGLCSVLGLSTPLSSDPGDDSGGRPLLQRARLGLAAQDGARYGLNSCSWHLTFACTGQQSSAAYNNRVKFGACSLVCHRSGRVGRHIACVLCVALQARCSMP